MDILQQDRRESAEQRQELCDIITRLQGELQSTEEQRDKVGGEGEGSGQSTGVSSFDLVGDERGDVLAAGVAVRAAAAQGQDAPAGLGDGAEEKRVLL